jgi:hypothetical protein
VIDDKTIADYRDVIKWSDNIYQRLDIEELLGLLSECIGDKSIDEEVAKYIEDYNSWWHKSAEAISCMGEVVYQANRFKKLMEDKNG